MDALTTVRQLAYATEIVQLLILATIYADAAPSGPDALTRRLRWSWVVFLLVMAFCLSWQLYGAYINAANLHDQWALMMTLGALALNSATANVIVRFMDFRKRNQ